MNRVLLNHYFDAEAWAVDCLRAFLAIKPNWAWDELLQEFVNLCVEIGAPRGAASQMKPLVVRLIQCGYLTMTSPGGKVHIEMGAWLTRRPRRSLVAAIRWAQARAKVESDCRDAHGRVLKQLEERPFDWRKAEAQFKRIKKRKAERLRAVDRTFKLKS